MTFPFKSIMCKKDLMKANDDSSNEGTESVLSNRGETTGSSPVVVAPGGKKRYMIIDETKLSKEEAERLQVKRAYNRECAERARKRSKETIKEFERQIRELQADKDELRYKVAAMTKEIETLTEKNKALSVASLYQGADVYSQFNIGRSNETAPSALNLYSRQQSLMLALSSNLDANRQNIGSGSLLPSWDYDTLMTLQQHMRK